MPTATERIAALAARPRRDRRVRRTRPRAAAVGARARLDQPALLPAAALARRRAGAARADRRRSRETGASVFQLVAALDAGDVFAESRATGARTTRPRATSWPRSPTRAPSCCAESSTRSPPAPRSPSPQPGEPTLAPKLGDDDGRIRWDEPRDAVLGADPRRHPRAGRAHDRRRRAAEGPRRARRARGRPAAASRASSSLHERAVLVGTATDAGRARARPAGRQGRRWRRGLVARPRATPRRRWPAHERRARTRAGSRTRRSAPSTSPTPTRTCCCPRRSRAPGSTPPTRRLATELTYGTLRRQGTYDAVIADRRGPARRRRSIRPCSTRCASACTSCSRRASPPTPP